MSYRVFLVEYSGAPRNHHAIFVETKKDGSGVIFQVTGNVQEGMTHDMKDAKRPEDSFSWAQVKKPLGIIKHQNYGRIDRTCREIPPPPKQFNGAKRINPSVPLFRCQEWTDQAIAALKNKGIIEKE
jgi:hypothetical protein